MCRAVRGAAAACRGVRRRALPWRLTHHAPLSAREEPLRQRSAPRGGLVVVVAAGAADAVEAAAVAELLEEEAQELARLDSCPPRKGGPREGTQIRARAARCITAEPAERASHRSAPRKSSTPSGSGCEVGKARGWRVGLEAVGRHRALDGVEQAHVVGKEEQLGARRQQLHHVVTVSDGKILVAYLCFSLAPPRNFCVQYCTHLCTVLYTVQKSSARVL